MSRFGVSDRRQYLGTLVRMSEGLKHGLGSISPPSGVTRFFVVIVARAV